MLKKDVIVTINDKQVKIKRMNLEAISYLTVKFGSKFLPLLNDLQGLQNTFNVAGELSLDTDLVGMFKDFDFTIVSKTLGLLTRQEIKELYELAFSHVYVQANDADTIFGQCLVDVTGKYTIPDMEYDVVFCMKVLFEVIKNNVNFITGSL